MLPVPQLTTIEHLQNIGNAEMLTEDQRSKMDYVLYMSEMEAKRGGSEHPLWAVVHDARALLNDQPTSIKGTPSEVFSHLMDLFVLHTKSHQ